MRWEEFLKRWGNLAVVGSEHLLAGSADPNAMKVQVSRWQKQGKLVQLRRGVYLLSPAYRKTPIFEPSLATILQYPSYVSLEKALEYHDLIPESVPVWTSITTKRPVRLETAMGTFDYRHVQISLFWGYHSLTLHQQTGFIADPEKALLDFFYFSQAEISLEYLEELRLQNVEKINLQRLSEYAQRFKKPKLIRVTQTVIQYVNSYQKGESQL